jgi:hypothetical protein
VSETHEASSAETTQVAPEIVDRARRLGWRPEEEYSGKRPWVPADRFIETAENELPVLRENLRRLDNLYVKETSALKTEIAEVKQVLTDFREFATRGEQRAYEKAKRELEEKRDVAVAHADTETFKATQKEIDELDKSVQPKKPVAEAVERPRIDPPDPAITSWIADNAWYTTDAELMEFAKAQDQFLIKTKPGLSVAERLEAVKNRTQKEFPDKFSNPRREQASSVAEPGSQTPRRKTGKTYDDLPAEAKIACDKFVKQIPNYKREDYLKDYDWS